MGSQCKMCVILLCILLLSPAYGESESPSQLLQILRKELKEMRLQVEQKEEELRIKLDELRIQRQQEKEEMRIKLEEIRIQREEDKEAIRLLREQEKEEMRRKFEQLRIQCTNEEEKSDLILKLDASRRKVETMEAQLPRENPVLISCAFKRYWDKNSSVITYDSHVIEGEGVGGMDLDTGRFTVGPGGSGYYIVTYSGRADLDSNEAIRFWLRRNGQIVGDHSLWLSYNSNGRVSDQGSKIVMLHLDEQDYLELWTDDSAFTGSLKELTLCVSLALLPYQ